MIRENGINPYTIKNDETEPSPEKLAMESVQKIMQKRGEKAVQTLDERLENITELLPAAAIEELNARIDELKRLGASDEIIEKVLGYSEKDMIYAYKDEKFDIPNFNFLRKKMSEYIDALLGEKPEQLEDLEKISVLFFDLDGLKSVNDFSPAKHAAGDKYIEKTCELLTKGKTVAWLKSLGISITSVRRSGDEFMVAASSSETLTDDVLFTDINGQERTGILIEEILRNIQEEVKNMDVNTDEILNLSDPSVRQNIKHIEEWPEGIKFQASISGGYASLKQAFFNLNEEQRGILNNGQYEEIISMLASRVYKQADQNLNANKESRTAERKQGAMHERVLEQVYHLPGREK